MSDQNDNGSPAGERPDANAGGAEHLNIKVTDNNNEVFFKIKRSTKLEKLMNAFCERQGKNMASLEMQDSDTLEVHQEQVGGTNC
ncbi:ubiquitin-related domain-containing protein [Apiospora phragmitis]|uniref:Ubiquitin-related domain-containing protein n=1 Tax=Apiospora phragmitis TaxID=2905665 RepID=A0ABR1TV16_9PEZI